MAQSSRPSGVMGPLTTTFTRPAHCSRVVAQCLDYCVVGWQAQTCTTGSPMNDLACIPPTTAAAPSPFYDYAYSPGIVCPSDYVMACTATHGDVMTTWEPYPTMLPGETAAVCCPSGYACPQLPGDACLSNPVHGAPFPVETCFRDTTAGYTYITLPYTPSEYPTTTVDAWLLSALPIQIRWRATDLPASRMTTTTLSSTASNTTGPASSPGSRAGLSTGAKAAIGVVVPVVLLIALCVGFLFWRKRGKLSSNTSEVQSSVEQREQPSELHEQARYEMDEQRRRHELGQTNVETSLERHELGPSRGETSWARHELNGISHR